MNTKLSVKFFILAVLVVFAVGIPTQFFYATEIALQESSRLERMGIEPGHDAIALIKKVQEHRGMSGQYINDPSKNTPIASKGDEVLQYFDRVQAELKEAFPGSDVNMHLASARSSFIVAMNEVRSRSIDASTSFTQQTEVVKEILLEVIPHIMEDSGLSYDPVASDYHMIIASFQDLPSLIEGLARVRGQGTAILASGYVSPAAHTQLNASLSYMELPFLHFIHNLEEAESNSDGNAGIKALQAKAMQIDTQIKNLLALINREFTSNSTTSYDSQHFFVESSEVINFLYGLSDDSSELLSSQLDDRIETSQTLLMRNLIIIIVIIALLIFISYAVIRSLNKALKEVSESAGKIAQGDFAIKLDTGRKDEFGPIFLALTNMAKRLDEAGQEREKVQREIEARLVETTRIEAALNATSTNVMIADADRTIIYMNRSVEKMLRGVEGKLRKALPHFRVDEIIGSNMDIFHKNPSHQADLLAALESRYQAQIKVSGLHFRLTANPIFNHEGNRIGSVVEWLDRTSEVEAESEITQLVEAAAAGDFTTRAKEDNKQDFMLFMAQALNKLMSTADHGLSDVARVLMALSNGDLTQRITQEYSGQFDDLKRYCNDTSESLTQMIGEIQMAAETISHAAAEIAQGNSDLSSRTENQASNLEETASSMEQMTSTVRQNSNNVSEANALSDEASKVAQDGAEQIKRVVNTMTAINESAQEISDIISVIDSIAFQTNILALNAAVEAARAGEQGRGFAVVASEVRTLAQRSADAAKDIKSLISDSVAKVAEGNKLVTQSGSIMEQIEGSIVKVSQLMSNIAAASKEQASGLDEINQAVVQMDESTQQNAALVEEAAASAESMRSQAATLKQNVLRFKVDTSSQSSSFSTGVASLPKPTQKKKEVIVPKPNIQSDDGWEEF